MNYTNIPAHEIRIIFQLWQSKHFSEWHFTLIFTAFPPMLFSIHLVCHCFAARDNSTQIVDRFSHIQTKLSETEF